MEVNIKIPKRVMALWKGQNTEKTSIEITLEDTDLHVFGQFLSSRLSFHHSLIPEPQSKVIAEYKKKLIISGRLIMNNLLAHATEQVDHYETFLVDFGKIYIRPIQIQQQSIFSMVKDYRSYCLPRSLDKVVRSKIITAPLLADTIWNIPSECEKALFDSNRKRG